MSKQRIVRVVAIGTSCEILCDTPAQAKSTKRVIEREGVWEAARGIRWQRIHPGAIYSVKIVKPQQVAAGGAK